MANPMRKKSNDHHLNFKQQYKQIKHSLKIKNKPD